jgi:hypothetical protein
MLVHQYRFVSRQTQHLNTVPLLIQFFSASFGRSIRPSWAETQVHNRKSMLWKRSLLNNSRNKIKQLAIIPNKGIISTEKQQSTFN